jgi:hypothetical protein
VSVSILGTVAVPISSVRQRSMIAAPPPPTGSTRFAVSAGCAPLKLAICREILARDELTLLAAALCLGVSMLALELSRAGMSAAATGASPERYYLALGDSIAYGIQPAKVRAGAPPSGFDSGFVDVFSARLRGLAPKVRVVNYSCPGESTKTFIAGGCPWLAEKRQLHDPFRVAQLTAALSFLRAHRLGAGAADRSAHGPHRR